MVEWIGGFGWRYVENYILETAIIDIKWVTVHTQRMNKINKL